MQNCKTCNSPLPKATRQFECKGCRKKTCLRCKRKWTSNTFGAVYCFGCRKVINKVEPIYMDC